MKTIAKIINLKATVFKDWKMHIFFKNFEIL